MSGAGYRQENVAEGWRRRGARLLLRLAADATGDAADATSDAATTRFGVAVALDHNRAEALARMTPMQSWEIDAVRVKPSAFAASMSVMTLLDVAGPATLPVSHDPAARTRRSFQTKMAPRLAICRMFKDAAVLPNCGERGLKAPTIVAEAILDAIGLARRSKPHTAPPLAGRMRDDRMRAGVTAGVAGFVPRIDAWQAEIAAVLFDIEGSDSAHLSPLAFVTAIATNGGNGGSDTGIAPARGYRLRASVGFVVSRGKHLSEAAQAFDFAADRRQLTGEAINQFVEFGDGAMRLGSLGGVGDIARATANDAIQFAASDRLNFGGVLDHALETIDQRCEARLAGRRVLLGAKNGVPSVVMVVSRCSRDFFHCSVPSVGDGGVGRTAESAHAFGVADMLSPRTGFTAIVDDDGAGIFGITAQADRFAAFGALGKIERTAIDQRLIEAGTAKTRRGLVHESRFREAAPGRHFATPTDSVEGLRGDAGRGRAVMSRSARKVPIIAMHAALEIIQ